MKTKGLLIGVLGMVFGGVVMFGLQREALPSFGGSEAVLSKRTKESGATSVSVGPPATRDASELGLASFSPIAMPADDAPALEVLKALSESAEAGHPQAACRLAIELQQCDQARIQREAVGAIQLGMMSGANASTGNVSFAAKLLEASDRLEARCQGVSRQYTERIFPYQLKAAAHNQRVARWLAVSPGLDRNDFLGHLDSWRQYQKFATNYFDRALKSAETDDLLPLMGVYLPHGGIGPRPPLRRDDDAMFVALFRLAQSKQIPVPDAYVVAARSVVLTPDLEQDIARKYSLLAASGWDDIEPGVAPSPAFQAPSSQECAQ